MNIHAQLKELVHVQIEVPTGISWTGQLTPVVTVDDYLACSVPKLAKVPIFPLMCP